jgi:signal transduction histidine kinase
MANSWDEARISKRPAEPAEREERRGRRRMRTSELTEEERAYRAAERRANAKIGFFRHLIVYSFVIAFMLFVARSGTAAAIIGLGWGIGLASHFFGAIVAPNLRQRWIHDEVQREVQRTHTRQRRALEGEKARSLEELSASIAHEIRNPITAAKSLVQQMGEDPASRDNVEYAAVALEELERVERSISHLLRYAREEDIQLRSMRLASAVESALAAVAERTAKLGVEVRSDLASDVEIDGDPEKLPRVFINLIGNALDAFEQGRTPQPRLELAVGASLAGTEVWARVRDNGPGMSPETQAKVFRPFYTEKTNGTGLGLAITRKLVDAHGGTIELESTPGQGSEFVLVFPRTGTSLERAR